ncbi:MAG: tail fiber protein [Oscillospiraceae bacterium]|nr:tail fiber protein [Oscillospiraceae bacterium]
MNVAHDKSSISNVKNFRINKEKQARGLKSDNILAMERKTNMIKKTIFYSILSCVVVITGSIILNNARDTYDMWRNLGNNGSKADYIESLKGDFGDKGFIGNEGVQGDFGISAYENWKRSDASNQNKNVDDFLETLVGDKGSKGISAYNTWKSKLPISASKSEQDFFNSFKGEVGLKGFSAYDLWRGKNPENKDKTHKEYLDLLRGSKGIEGLNAYESWKKENSGDGFISEADYLASLSGSQGEKGLSSYEVWKNLKPENNDLTVQDYLNSLRGEQGDAGASGGFKVGEIRAFLGEIDEEGWLKADGSPFDPIEHTDLFYTLGKDVVPDLKGTTLGMADRLNPIGSFAGANEILLTEVMLPSKTLTFNIDHSHANISMKTEDAGLHTHKLTRTIGSPYGPTLTPTNRPKGIGSFKGDTELTYVPDHTHTIGNYDVQQDILNVDVFINNTGGQKAIDNRQSTKYIVYYIFAGY